MQSCRWRIYFKIPYELGGKHCRQSVQQNCFEIGIEVLRFLPHPFGNMNWTLMFFFKQLHVCLSFASGRMSRKKPSKIQRLRWVVVYEHWDILGGEHLFSSNLPCQDLHEVRIRSLVECRVCLGFGWYTCLLLSIRIDGCIYWFYWGSFVPQTWKQDLPVQDFHEMAWVWLRQISWQVVWSVQKNIQGRTLELQTQRGESDSTRVCWQLVSQRSQQSCFCSSFHSSWFRFCPDGVLAWEILQEITAKCWDLPSWIPKVLPQRHLYSTCRTPTAPAEASGEKPGVGAYDLVIEASP